MRCACVDIGSNTTRLLVAEREGLGLRAVAVQRAFTSLGAGRNPSDALPAAKIADVAAAVAQQVAYARAHGAVLVVAVATAAIRSAPNAQDLLDAVMAAAEIEVKVLTGDAEAALAFRGATATCTEAGLVGVTDIGGGSTELVLGTPGSKPIWAVSLPVGSARLPEASDPPTGPDIDALRALVAAEFSDVEPPQAPTTALAAGGSATSVYRLVGRELSADAIAGALEVLRAAPVAEVAQRTGLDPRRVALLPAGLVLLEAVGAKFGVPLRIADGGLREGILLAELDRLGA